MFFSEWFQVDADIVKAYGAIDISLVYDIPLFHRNEQHSESTSVLPLRQHKEEKAMR